MFPGALLLSQDTVHPPLFLLLSLQLECVLATAPVAVKKHHDQGNLEKKALNWGIAYTDSEGESPQSLWQEAWQQAGWHWGTGAVAESLNLIASYRQRENLKACTPISTGPRLLVVPLHLGDILFQTTHVVTSHFHSYPKSNYKSILS